MAAEGEDMLEELRQQVYEANMQLPRLGLVTFTWGNVSGIDRERGIMAIKPSGVDYEKLSPENMVLVDIATGKTVGEGLRPSSDTPTHVELYRSFSDIGGVVHTHSTFATSWAQAGRDISCYGTTHADYFYGSVPCLRVLSPQEIDAGYETNTGLLITGQFRIRGIDPAAVPACLCENHGPFAWGRDCHEAVHNAAVLEYIAKMAYQTELINKDVKPAPQHLMDKHYFRKHGAGAYYGQN